MSSFLKQSLVFFTASLLAGCGQVFELVYCDYGYGAVQNNRYQTGAKLLNKCLELDRLSTEQRAKYLQGRAFYKQGKGVNAKEEFSEFLSLIGDQQVNIPEALKQELRELPSEYDEFKNL